MTTLEHDWYPQALPDNVEVGEGTWLYSTFSFLHYRSRRPVGARIGRHCGIYIGTLFDLGPNAELTIGDHSTLAGPILCTKGRIEIGDRVLVSSRVLIADDPVAVPPPDSSDAQPSTAAEPPVSVSIGDDVWIGTGAIVLGGARIGGGSIIGAATVVDFEVPSGAIVAGDPARTVGWC